MAVEWFVWEGCAGRSVNVTETGNIRGGPSGVEEAHIPPSTIALRPGPVHTPLSPSHLGTPLTPRHPPTSVRPPRPGRPASGLLPPIQFLHAPLPHPPFTSRPPPSFPPQSTGPQDLGVLLQGFFRRYGSIMRPSAEAVSVAEGGIVRKKVRGVGGGGGVGVGLRRGGVAAG